MARRLMTAVALASAAALAGCGGGADATDLPPSGPRPAAAVPVAPSAPVVLGEPLHAGPRTPPAVARALARHRVLVIGFVLSRPQDDRAGAHAVARLRRSEAGSDGVSYFVYRVDRTRSFGDLPELLDVEGTPTVAVIGRDGRLRNRFSGWTDAAVLRQAVVAAKERAPRDGERRRVAARPTGDRAGIALARRVNDRYRSVPGVRMTGSAIDDRLGPAELRLEARLRGGRVTAWAGGFSVGTMRLEMATASGALRARLAGADCWAGVPATEAVLGVGEPMITLAGARVGAPERDGAELRLPVTLEAGGETLRGAYRIDRRTLRLISVEAPALSATVTDLPTAPAAPPPQPVCADPSEAFAGMPGAATP